MHSLPGLTIPSCTHNDLLSAIAGTQVDRDPDDAGKAVTRALQVGPAATIRDGSRSAATPRRSRHGEHRRQGEHGGDAHWRACQQSQFAE